MSRFKLPKLTERQEQIATLKAAGLTQNEIASQLGVSVAAVSKTLKAVAHKGYSITSLDMLCIAKKTIKMHLKGASVGKVMPTAASQMKAALAIIDRSEPRINKSISLNLEAKVAQVFDLSQFRNVYDT